MFPAPPGKEHSPPSLGGLCQDCFIVRLEGCLGDRLGEIPAGGLTLQLNDSTVVTEPFMIVSGGRAGGVSPELHDHLHGFERVKL